MLPDNQTAASLYQALATLREPFLTKARRCAELTLPFVLPKDGSAGQDLPTPYQSVGARGVNNLASKLLLSLLPPNTPFFKLTVDAFALKKVDKDAKLKTKLEEALSEIEQASLVEIERSASRVTANEALIHLIIAGNGLLEVPSKGNLKFTRLDRYVVQRDPMGHPLNIIILDKVAPSALPEVLRNQKPPRGAKTTAEDSEDKQKGKEKTVEIYTVCHRESSGEGWEVWQECRGKEIPDSRGTYPIDKLPFLPLRFFKIDGEDYGRGYVEQYLGDLVSLEGLEEAIVLGAQAAARVLFLVAPNGLTDADRLAKANNGDFVAGRVEDVVALQLQKFADFKVAADEAAKIERRLSEAFMLMSGLQRDAERVTAEEIRALVQELETSLGGVYSVLSQEFQLPLAVAFMDRMSKDGRLPKLPKKIVAPTITTGVEALGRGNDLQKLDALVKDLAQTFGPEAVARYVVVGDYLTRRSTALGMNPKGLIRTEEEVVTAQAQAQQQAQMQELATKLGPAAIRELGPAAMSGALQQQQ